MTVLPHAPAVVPPAARVPGARTPDVRAPAARFLAIASGKGGVGKTWFAITLAHALSRAGRRVLLFDGDFGLANVDIQLGLTPPHDLAKVIAGRVALREAMMRHAAGGFSIIAGRSGSGLLSSLDTATVDWVTAALRGASTGYDVVLLDLGAGLEPPVRRLTALADGLLVVATEEPTSLTDAYAVLKLHAADRSAEDPSPSSRVVINQATNRAAGERTFATLQRACETFLGRAPRLLGVVRRDDHVRDAIRRQALLLTRHPACPAAEDVEHIARVLLAGLPPA